MMIGTADRARISRHTSSPSISGSRKSSSTTSASACGERLAAGAARVTSNPSRASPFTQRLGERVLVLDDKHAHALIMRR